MNNSLKKRITHVSIVIILSLVAVSFYVLNDKTKEKEPEIPGSSEKKLEVVVIGESHPFKGNDEIAFTELSLDDARNEIPSDIRFLLINDSISVPKATLEQWIKKKKVVLFYGEDVSPEEIEKKFGVDFNLENILIQSSIKIPFILFGYGYSQSNERETVWFLNGNKDMSSSVLTFIESNEDK